MWTPTKRPKLVPDQDTERLCHTELRNDKAHRMVAEEERKEDNETPSTNIFTTVQTVVKEPPREESKSMGSEINHCKTVKRSAASIERIELECSGDKLIFDVFRDSEIGLQEIAEDIISTTMDDDVRTSTELLERAERECMRDMFEAIEAINDQKQESGCKNGKEE